MVMMSVRESIRLGIEEEMNRDPDVFIIGEEVAQYNGAYKVTKGLWDKFGSRRVVDTPITEHGFTGLACGAAMHGLKPIVEFMTWNFAMQAMDHIINSAAKTLYMSGGLIKSSIVFRGPNGSAAGVGAQHSQCYASWYAHIPGLIVIAPYTASDHKSLIKAAIRTPNPVVFLENELLYSHEHEWDEGKDNNSEIVGEIGKAHVIREGKDVTIIAFSLQVKTALDATKILESEGVDAEVIDLCTLRPLDIKTIIESVKKTNRVVVVEEGWSYSGIASEIAMVISENAFDYLDAPVERVTAKDVPLPYANNLEKLSVPRPNDVVGAVKRVCYAV